MRSMIRPLVILAAAGACAMMPCIVSAETDLIESIWISQSPKCAIREIRFYDFEHALVKADPNRYQIVQRQDLLKGVDY